MKRRANTGIRPYVTTIFTVMIMNHSGWFTPIYENDMYRF